MDYERPAFCLMVEDGNAFFGGSEGITAYESNFAKVADLDPPLLSFMALADDYPRWKEVFTGASW